MVHPDECIGQQRSDKHCAGVAVTPYQNRRQSDAAG